MRGLWLENQQLSFDDDLPLPVPGEGEALVKVRLAGICATDLEMVKGYYPFSGIPGHEFVGEVIECADQPELIGKRVVGEINISCGTCDECLNGRRTHCRQRKVLGINQRNGVFADFCTLPYTNLHEVPRMIADEMAVFTEPLAAALEIQQQVHIKPTDKVLLVGAGRLGQLIAQTLAICSCEFRVVTRHASQKALLSKRGVEVIDESDIPPGEMDVVIDASGSAQGFHIAKRAVRPAGVLVMKSTYKGEMTLDMSSVVVDEITLVGSRCGPFEPALRLLTAGLIDPSPLIDSVYSIENGLMAFDWASKPGVFKVLLKP